MKMVIDLNDEALELAANELGTTTKQDAVNAALKFVANRRPRIEQLLDDPYALGVGPDIADSGGHAAGPPLTVPIGPGQQCVTDTSAHARLDIHRSATSSLASSSTAPPPSACG